MVRKMSFLTIGFGLSVLFFGIAWIGILIHEENIKNIQRSWRVNKIFENSNNTTNNYYAKNIIFSNYFSDFQLYHPYRKYHQDIALYRSKWAYRRRSLFNGQIIMKNTPDGIFDGIYEVEFLKKNQPRVVRFYSDRVEFICTEQYFSLEKPYIKNDDWFYVPESILTDTSADYNTKDQN